MREPVWLSPQVPLEQGCWNENGQEVPGGGGREDVQSVRGPGPLLPAALSSRPAGSRS